MQLGPDTGDTSGAEVTEASPAPARCPAADQALDGVALEPGDAVLAVFE